MPTLDKDPSMATLDKPTGLSLVNVAAHMEGIITLYIVEFFSAVYVTILYYSIKVMGQCSAHAHKLSCMPIQVQYILCM